MIVGLRSIGQAARVASLTGGEQLPGKPRRDGTAAESAIAGTVAPCERNGLVDVGPDFEAHRPAVESVSVLFDLHGGDAAAYAATGSPGTAMATGWTVTAAKFEVEWPTDPQRCEGVKSH
ncbi:MAG: hypothetical protein ACJ74F_24135, partial [Mycobacterium sp.]